MSEEETDKTILLEDKYEQSAPNEQYSQSWKDLLEAPKDLWLLYGIKLFAFTAIYTLSSTLSIYITEARDESDLFLGTLFVFLALASFAFSVLLGNISDRYGLRSTIIIGSFLQILKFILLFVVNDVYWQIVILSFVSVPSSILITPTTEAGIKHFTAPNYRSLAISLYWSITFVASLIAGIAVTIFFFVGDEDQSTFDVLFLFCGGSGCIALGLSLFLERANENLSENQARIKEERKLSWWEHSRQVFILKNFWRLGSVIIMVALIKIVFNQTTNALPLYMDRDLGDDSLYGITLILNQIVAIAITPFLNYFAYYFTEYEMFMISGCIATISPLLFLLGPSYYAVFWFVISSAIGEALLLLIIVQYSLKIAPVGKEGVIITVINIPIYVSLYVAGILNGFLLNEFCPDEGEGERQCWKLWGIVSLLAVAPTLVLFFCKQWLEDKKFESNPFIPCCKEAKDR